MAWFVDQLSEMFNPVKEQLLVAKEAYDAWGAQNRKQLEKIPGMKFLLDATGELAEMPGADYFAPMGVVAQNFRSPTTIQALRKMMAQEQRARGPIGTAWDTSAARYTPKDFENLYNGIPDEYLAAVERGHATGWSPLVEATDPIDQILRGSWYHGMSGKAREVVADKLPDFYGAKQWYPRGAPHIPPGERFLTSASEIGFPISHHDAASISKRFGEPSGVSLSMLPTKAKGFSADEYIHRVLPIYGGPPTKRALNLMGQEGRTTLNDVYDVALNKYMIDPEYGLRSGLLEDLADDFGWLKAERFAGNTEMSYKDIMRDFFNEMATSSSAQRAFNPMLSQELQNKGYRGILYNPKRWDEYEMLMLDPKYVLPLDYRKMGEYLPEGLARRGPATGAPIIAATPGTRRGLSQIDDLMSQNASRLGDIYNERPFASRINEENRRRLWDLIDPSLRESVFNELFP